MIGGSAFAVGLVVLLVELGAVLTAAFVVTARRLGHLRGHSQTLGYAVVATALLLSVNVLPGILGVLNRWAVLGTSLLFLGGSCLVKRQRTSGQEDPPTPAKGEHWLSWLGALVGAGLVTGYAIAYLHGHFFDVPTGIDALNFHLPGVARWITTHTLWEINQFVPQQAHGDYPQNGDVVFLALLLPFKSALLVRGAMVPFLLLTGVGSYAIGREVDAPRPASLLFAAALCAVPVVMRPALLDTQTDTLALFGLAAGTAFLLRHRRTGLRSDLIIAGLSLGISFGTKWYMVVYVPAMLVAWALACGATGIPVRAIGRRLVLLIGLVLAAGGFWLLRNLVESANPVFPVKVAPLGITLFNAPRDVIQQLGGFTIADYLGAPHILGKYILPALRDTVSWLGLLFLITVLGAGGVAARDLVRKRRAELSGEVTVLCVGALMLAALYLFIPDTALGPHNRPAGTDANTRYLMPALVLAAPVTAWLSGRLRRVGPVVELAGLGLIVQALSRVFALGSSLSLSVMVIVVAGGALWLRRSGGGEHRSMSTRWRAMPVVALLLLITGLGAVWAQRHFNYTFYAQGDSTLGWLLEHARYGHNVGLAGVWTNTLAPPFPAFGPRFGNRVTYVGPFVDHMLQQYGSARPFEAALNRGRYDLLFIGRGFPTPKPSVPQESWAIAAGFHEVARSWQLTLFAR